MRMTLSIDSATAEEARAFVVAFQRTRHLGAPVQLCDDPTVKVMGIGWGVTLPPLYANRAQAVMEAFAEEYPHLSPTTEGTTPCATP